MNIATNGCFEVKSYERKWVVLDFELHALIQQFGRERQLSTAEAVHVLIGPATVALNGGDYQKVLEDFGLIQKTGTPQFK